MIESAYRNTGSPSPAGRRVVLTTIGSLGDLHPFLAVALGLKERGHRPILVTQELHRQRVEAAGIDFRRLRLPGGEQLDPGLVRRVMDLRRGPEVVIRELIMPGLREAYEDTRAAAAGADLLISHPLTYTTRLVAEKAGIPWASCVLQPSVLFSSYDPPVLAPALFLANLRFLGPTFHGLLFRFFRRALRAWSQPWHQFRAEVGLPPTREEPIMEGQHSPHLVLGLFSPLLADRQRDWPARLVVTGFPFYDRDGPPGLPDALEAFLKAGPPPIAFTLGSSAVMDAGEFYARSAAAATALGRRAVLLTGRDTNNRPPSLPDGILAVDYAPYTELLPRCAATVHQGGVGTTGQAMRAAVPMLVMPYAHDQPDNAARVVRLGMARTVPRSQYTANRAANELRCLLEFPRYRARAAEVGRRVLAEDGVRAACDALEDLLRTR